MNVNFLRIISLTVALGVSSLIGHAAAPVEPDPFELDFEQNINTPAVPQKKHTSVKNAIENIRSTLDRSGFQTKKLRQGEALVVTIPCDRLFKANETTLTERGKALLGRFKLNDDAEGKFKVIIAVHTDNTGEANYADSITAARANAVDDFLNGSMSEISIPTIPYGLGRDEQLVSNDSVRNRATNRRVEIYIVPTSAMFGK